jgi:hypothetical protein
MTSRHMSDGASMRALSRRDITYRALHHGSRFLSRRVVIFRPTAYTMRK